MPVLLFGEYICFIISITMVKLYVGGFRLDITELELVMLVSLHGEVSTIKIVRDKKTGICKGYAFIEMKDKENADRVIEALDGTFMGERMLSIKITEDKPTPVKKPFQKFNSNFSPKPSYLKVERKGAEVKNKRPRKQF